MSVKDIYILPQQRCQEAWILIIFFIPTIFCFNGSSSSTMQHKEGKGTARKKLVQNSVMAFGRGDFFFFFLKSKNKSSTFKDVIKGLFRQIHSTSTCVFQQ